MFNADIFNHTSSTNKVTLSGYLYNLHNAHVTWAPTSNNQDDDDDE